MLDIDIEVALEEVLETSAGCGWRFMSSGCLSVSSRGVCIFRSRIYNEETEEAV